LKNKCCLYVIISILFFSITICNLLIESPSNLVVTWKQSTHKETKDLGLMLKREEHSNFSAQGLGLTEAGIKEFEAIDMNKQNTETTRQRITRMLACCEEIPKEKQRSLSCHPAVLDFFRSASGLHI